MYFKNGIILLDAANGLILTNMNKRGQKRRYMEALLHMNNPEALLYRRVDINGQDSGINHSIPLTMSMTHRHNGVWYVIILDNQAVTVGSPNLL